jgi:hypothetical protein
MEVRRRLFVTMASVGALVAAAVPMVVAGGHAQAAPFNLHHLNQIQQRLISSELINAAGPQTSAAIGDNPGQGSDGSPEGTPPDSPPPA